VTASPNEAVDREQHFDEESDADERDDLAHDDGPSKVVDTVGKVRVG
jgi:hypothetical protein